MTGLRQRLPPAAWTLRLAGRAALVWVPGRGLLAFAGLDRTNVVAAALIAVVVGAVLLVDLVRRGGDLLLGNLGVSKAVVVAIGATTAAVGEILLHLFLAAIVP